MELNDYGEGQLVPVKVLRGAKKDILSQSEGVRGSMCTV